MRKLITLLLLLTTVCLALNGLAAQKLAATTIPLAEVEQLQLPRLDNKELLRAEQARRAPGVAPRFAETIEVDVSPATHGTWEVNRGTAVWRLRVPSPGAKSLNFGFDRYRMPEGGQLMLYTPDGALVQGPFTPADNEEHEELWTPAIAGDELVIEISLPAARRSELLLHLKSVNHDFLGFADVASSIMSGSCNLDVVCGADDGWGIVDGYRDIIQSVAVISTGGGTFCTGFLVSNTRQDCAPFFMTADHCGIGNNNAPSLVVYWNFINSVCRQPNSPESGAAGDGLLADFNTGSIFRAAHPPSDMTLVELDDPVSETANAWFAGWNATTELETDTIIAVHHPSTDEKRISFEFDGSYLGTWGQGSTPVPNGDHLIIADWDIGTTEPGSSGSPIFNSDKQVIGQLHGGAAACGNNAYDSYGWFHTSWEGGGTPSTRLRDWLDPDNTGLLEIPGRGQVQCSFFAGATPVSQTLCAPASASYDIDVNETFAGPVTLSVVGLPAGLTASFDETVVNPGGGTQMSITGTQNLAQGTYTFVLNGTDGTNESNQTLTLNVLAGAPAAVTLVSPEDMATDQFTGLTLSWQAQDLSDSYEIQVATDAAFSNILSTGADLENTTFQATALDILTTYYWRVRSTNICGTGDWSEAFTFTTAAISCSLNPADTDGVTIGPQGGTVTTSAIFVDQPGAIVDVKINNFSTNHTWVGDLNMDLISPAGTSIRVFNEPNCDSQGILASFSDVAGQSSADFEATCDGGAIAITGTFQPADAFATFAGEDATGEWQLVITDNANGDSGDLLGWELEICTAIPSVVLTTSAPELNACTGEDASVDITVGVGFTGDVTLSADNLPPGVTAAFESNPVSPGSTVNVTLSNLTESGITEITFTGTDGTETAFTAMDLIVETSPENTVLTSPPDMATDIALTTSLTWAATAGAETYVMTLSTTADMANPVLVTPTAGLATAANGLAYNTTYYWQVIASNDCGAGAAGAVFSFTTTPNISVSTTQAELQSCLSDATAAVFTLGEGFGDEPMVAIDAAPAADFSGFTQSFNTDNRELTLAWDNFLGIAPGTYTLDVTVTGAGYSGSSQLTLEITTAPALSSLILPLDDAIVDVENPVAFSWETVDGATGYTIEVATDDNFTNIVVTDEVSTPAYATTLAAGQYYWRVTTMNDCGESITEFFVFTAEIINAVVEVNGARISIWPNPTSGPLQITLAGELNNDLTVGVMTVHGQLIRQERFVTRTGVQLLDLSDLPAGAYLLRLTSGQAGRTLRIIVQ